MRIWKMEKNKKQNLQQFHSKVHSAIPDCFWHMSKQLSFISQELRSSQGHLWKANSCRRGHGGGKGVCNLGSWTALASPWTQRGVLYWRREGRAVCLISIHFTKSYYSDPSPSPPQINFIAKSHVLHYPPSAQLLLCLILLYLLFSSVTDFYALCILKGYNYLSSKVFFKGGWVPGHVQPSHILNIVHDLLLNRCHFCLVQRRNQVMGFCSHNGLEPQL